MSDLPDMNRMGSSQWLAVALGLGGGLGVASMAYEHLRVEGVDEDERKGLLKVFGAAGFAAALMYLVEVPKHYVVLDEETIEHWKGQLPDMPTIPEQWGTVP